MVHYYNHLTVRNANIFITSTLARERERLDGESVDSAFGIKVHTLVYNPWGLQAFGMFNTYSKCLKYHIPQFSGLS